MANKVNNIPINRFSAAYAEFLFGEGEPNLENPVSLWNLEECALHEINFIIDKGFCSEDELRLKQEGLLILYDFCRKIKDSGSDEIHVYRRIEN